MVKNMVEQEGGTIEGIGSIGMLIHSPFPPVNLKPIYLKVKCAYSQDRGYWLICSPDKSPTQWVWVSEFAASSLPALRPISTKVANDVIVVPLVLSVTVYALAVGGVILGLWYFFMR
jgi:hypothetical protein